MTSFEDITDGLPNTEPQPTPEALETLASARANQEPVSTRARAMIRRVLAATTEAIERTGSFSPVVLAEARGQSHIYHPEWSGPLEKSRVFSELDQKLEDIGATITVCAAPGTFVDEDLSDADEIREHPRSCSAIILVTHTAAWKELQALPYTRDPDGVEWHEPFVANDFQTRLVSVPRAN